MSKDNGPANEPHLVQFVQPLAMVHAVRRSNVEGRERHDFYSPEPFAERIVHEGKEIEVPAVAAILFPVYVMHQTEHWVKLRLPNPNDGSEMLITVKSQNILQLVKIHVEPKLPTGSSILAV